MKYVYKVKQIFNEVLPGGDEEEGGAGSEGEGSPGQDWEEGEEKVQRGSRGQFNPLQISMDIGVTTLTKKAGGLYYKYKAIMMFVDSGVNWEVFFLRSALKFLAFLFFLVLWKTIFGRPKLIFAGWTEEEGGISWWEKKDTWGFVWEETETKRRKPVEGNFKWLQYLWSDMADSQSQGSNRGGGILACALPHLKLSFYVEDIVGFLL